MDNTKLSDTTIEIAENAEELRQIVLEQVKIQEACLNKSDQYGQRYYVDFTLNRQNRSATIHS